MPMPELRCIPAGSPRHHVMRSSRRGIALATIFLTLLLLFVLVASSGTLTLQNLADMAHGTYDRQAYYAARAGLALGLAQVRANPTWSAGLGTQFLPTNRALTCTVSVTNNSAGASAVHAPDGSTVPAGTVYLRADGTAPNQDSRARVTRTVSALVTAQTGLFTNALVGTSSLSMSGSASVDAFNSASGPYVHSGTSNRNAPVITNSTVAGAVTMSGGTSIDGNVTIGPGGTPSSVISTSGSANYTGVAVVPTTAWSAPAITPPLSGSGPNESVSGNGTLTLSPGVYGSLSASGGGTVTLTAGTYLFTSNVTLSGGSSLVIPPSSGPVIIYLEGSWDSSGGTVSNASGLASHLQVYGTDTATSITVSGGSSAYMAIYARQAAVSLTGSGAIYGALAGKTITMSGGSAVHYDLALTSTGPTGTGGSSLSLTSFRRW